MPHTVVQLSKRLATELLKNGAFRRPRGTRWGAAEANWREAENLYSAVEPVQENFQPPSRAARVMAGSLCRTPPGDYSRNSTVGPVILCPDDVTQSVRNVWLPLSALHHRVGCVIFSPGDSVTDSVGALTCEPLKKLTR